MLSSIINGVSDIADWIGNLIDTIQSVFTDVNFSVLWASIFPADISDVMGVLIFVLLFIAVIGIVKKIAFFMG